MTILGTINNYRAYRKNNLRNAWRLSGMNELFDQFWGIVRVIMIVLCSLYLLSEQANAIAEHRVDRLQQVVNDQAEVIDGLKSLTARCLSTGDNSIQIGDELWFCGAAPTGVKL